MRKHRNRSVLLFFLFFSLLAIACRESRVPVEISGELRQWHKITLTTEGPEVAETDSIINPFLDYRMTVSFQHAEDNVIYTVPGYFAADGRAGETSATSGSKWRAHFSPDRTGTWKYQITILRGKNVAVEESAEEVSLVLSRKGSFEVAPSDKTGRDFRAKGRLAYVGERYLQFTGTGEYFLKAGADSPENLLASADFDGTWSHKAAGITRENEATTTNLKTWEAHIRDWQPGDPSWKDGKGKGLIGAFNYLSGKGCNAVSFLTYNAGGDGDDVWPFSRYGDKLHYDCSKLDQWQILFDHAQQRGLFLHFKLQETENDDNFLGEPKAVPAALDGGELGTERKLYLRELVARFGYLLALNWNLGEENTQSPAQQKAMAAYLAEIDPWQHLRVIHTFPDWQERVYTPLLGDQSELTGMSMQNVWTTCHARVVYWLNAAEQAGKIWVVANDEQNPHYTGVPPDSGFAGFTGIARPENYSPPYTADDIRKYTLWGVLMAGGAGVEYYFGYTLPENDLGCQNWRSRDQSWNYCRYALQFFTDNHIPFQEMKNTDERVGNPVHENTAYCFSKPGEIYLVYLPTGGNIVLQLGDDSDSYTAHWYNPREGGKLIRHDPAEIRGPGNKDLGPPPADKTEDWIILLRKAEKEN